MKHYFASSSDIMPHSSTSSLRPTPPLSPTKSLYGLEKAVPPRSPSAKTASPPNTNKPLPLSPRRSSSVYSTDSAYTNIIESYLSARPQDTSGGKEIIHRTVPQPKTYRETISDLLNRKLDEPKLPSSIRSLPSISSYERRSAVSTPFSQAEISLSTALQNPYGDDQVAPDETPSITSDQTSPGISPLPTTPPKALRNPFDERASRVIAARYPPLTLQQGPEFRAISYSNTEKYLPGPLSPRITDVVDPGLVPDPLTIPRSAVEERPASRFSQTSSSASSTVFNHGIRDSLRDYVLHMRKKRKDAVQKRESDRIISTASAKYPHMKVGSDAQSGIVSRRMSVQHGLATIYDKIRKLSLSGSSETSEEIKDPRRRPRQYAIPMSPYQKSGPIIWDKSKRQERGKQRIREERQGTELIRKSVKQGKSSQEKSSEGKDKRRSAPPSLVASFHSGQSHLISALNVSTPRAKRTKSEKRREALKRSIRLIGPADQFPDGRVNHWI